MLRPRPRPGGFTLVELLVTLALIAIVLTLAAPAVGGWTADAGVRSTAESLQSALRLAQSSAVARSRSSVFALTSASPVRNAAPSANANGWYVQLMPLADSDEGDASDLFIQGAAPARQYGVTVSGPALLCFNSLGQQTSRTADATGLSTACTAPSNDASTPTEFVVSRSGASRQLRVRVYLGGRVRMCDAAKTLSNANPDGC